RKTLGDASHLQDRRGVAHKERAGPKAGPPTSFLHAELGHGTGLSLPDFMSSVACLILSVRPAGTGLRFRISETPIPSFVASLVKLPVCLPLSLKRLIPSRTALRSLFSALEMMQPFESGRDRYWSTSTPMP